MLATNILRWFRGTGIVMFVAGMAITINPEQVLASEEIIFKYGAATQSVSLTELQTFADTGEMSSSLDFLLKFSQQNPQLIRWILRQQFPADTKLIYDLLNTAPGEYVLTQTSTPRVHYFMRYYTISRSGNVMQMKQIIFIPGKL